MKEWFLVRALAPGTDDRVQPSGGERGGGGGPHPLLTHFVCGLTGLGCNSGLETYRVDCIPLASLAYKIKHPLNYIYRLCRWSGFWRKCLSSYCFINWPGWRLKVEIGAHLQTHLSCEVVAALKCKESTANWAGRFQWVRDWNKSHQGYTSRAPAVFIYGSTDRGN